MAHENIHLSNGNYEARSSKLTDENAKCRVEFERSYNYLRLVAACSRITQTSIKVRKTKLLPLVLLRAQKRILGKLCTELSSVHFAEMTGERALLHCM